MAFDGIVVAGLARELNQLLSEAKVEKIYQPEKDELVLFLYAPEGKKKLYLSCNNHHPGLYLTQEQYTNPEQPPSFCMLLRKHLQTSKIQWIRQKDRERIIEIQFETKNDMQDIVKKKLIVEIMGKHSNVTLVELPSMTILDCLKHVSFEISRARQLLPGLSYEYPPSQGKTDIFDLTEETLSCVASHANPSEKLLDLGQGLSPLVAGEITKVPEKERIQKELRTIQNTIFSMAYQPTVYQNHKSEVMDFHIIPISSYEKEYQTKKFSTISESIAFYYTHRDSANRIKQKSLTLHKSVQGLLKKSYLKKQRLLEDLDRAKDHKKYQLYGELLTANLHQVPSGKSQVNLYNYYDDTRVDLTLDPRLSPSQNAQRYFKKYAKSKVALVEKKVQLDLTLEDIAYLESVQTHLSQVETVEEVDNLRLELAELGYVRKSKLPKRTGKKQPQKYQSSRGFTIWAGKNNKENDHITFHLAKKEDLWFHTKDIPGSHVVLITDRQKVDPATLEEAASIAAYYSKGRNSENVPVDYTQIAHVKKPKGAKPGKVIFTHNKTLYVTPKLPE